MRTSNIFIIGLITILLSGCASNQAKNHLKLKEIDEGLALTSKELKNSPNNSDLNYYHGRFLISQKKYQESSKYFKKAAESFPYKTFHKFWLGVSYGKYKEYEKERQIYLEILNEKNWRYRNALAYLGKNYYKTKEYQKAKEIFEKGLAQYKKPHSYMYYYYALTLKRTNQIEKAKEYFHKYLKTFPEFSLAKGAIYNLNKLGDFTYSNFKIGEEIASVKNIEYLDETENIEYYSKKSLRTIANMMLENKNLTLYVVSYDKNSLTKAEKRVKNIKKYILSQYPEIEFSDIKIAWLKTDKKINIGKSSFKQNKYINFFTKNKEG